MPMPPEPSLRLERGVGKPASDRRLPLAAASEEALRTRIVERDERALAELITTTTPWLLGVARGMLRDTDDAEDVVMEVFRTLWTTLDGGGDGATGLMPLLLRMTRQRAIDKLRQRARGIRLAEALTPGELARFTVQPVEPNEASQPGWHIHLRVHEALGALPAEQRSAVMLAYFDGLAQSEIAVRLGVPLGTVKTRLRLAFGKLRTTLAPLKDWVP